jgi:hypothetical protein
LEKKTPTLLLEKGQNSGGKKSLVLVVDKKKYL